MSIDRIILKHKNSLKRCLLILGVVMIMDVVALFITDFNMDLLTLLLFVLIVLVVLSFCEFLKIEELNDFYSFMVKKKLVSELDNILLETTDCFFTNNYIFKIKDKTYIKYSEIVLMYNYYIPRSRGIVRRKCCFITKGRKKFKIDNPKTSYEQFSGNELQKLILEKNPNVLVGKTKENKKILLEKYGINL